MEKMENLIIGEDVFSLVACSVKGRNKLANQDSYKIYYENGCLIVVVADGLGSAPFSDEGSRKIVEVLVEKLKQNDIANICYEVLNEWKLLIKGDYDKYDTTAKFIKITPTKIEYGGVGDGWIVLSDNVNVTSLEMNHVFSNQTDTILSIGLKDKFVYKSISANQDTMLISTDGFSEDIEKNDALDVLKEFKIKLLENIDDFSVELQSLLEDWPVASNVDDKTIVIIQRVGGN